MVFEIHNRRGIVCCSDGLQSLPDPLAHKTKRSIFRDKAPVGELAMASRTIAVRAISGGEDAAIEHEHEGLEVVVGRRVVVDGQTADRTRTRFRAPRRLLVDRPAMVTRPPPRLPRESPTSPCRSA